jgi:hypothetical protein
MSKANEDYYNAQVNNFLNWGCNNVADIYADAVNTFFGAWAFQLSNDDRCECKCPIGTFDCGANCMMKCEGVNDEATVEINKGAPQYYQS